MKGRSILRSRFLQLATRSGALSALVACSTGPSSPLTRTLVPGAATRGVGPSAAAVMASAAPHDCVEEILWDDRTYPRSSGPTELRHLPAAEVSEIVPELNSATGSGCVETPSAWLPLLGWDRLAIAEAYFSGSVDSRKLARGSEILVFDVASCAAPLGARWRVIVADSDLTAPNGWLLLDEWTNVASVRRAPSGGLYFVTSAADKLRDVLRVYLAGRDGLRLRLDLPPYSSCSNRSTGSCIATRLLTECTAEGRNLVTEQFEGSRAVGEDDWTFTPVGRSSLSLAGW